MDDLPTLPYSLDGDDVKLGAVGAQSSSVATRVSAPSKLDGGEGVSYGSGEEFSMEEPLKYRSLPASAFSTSFQHHRALDGPHDAKGSGEFPFPVSPFGGMDLAQEPVYRSVSVESFAAPSLKSISPSSKLRHQSRTPVFEEDDDDEGLFSAAAVRVELLPCPIYYEKSTSFRAPGFPKQIIASIVDILSCMNNVDILSTKPHQMKISAVVYISDQSHAFKIFLWQWEDPEQCLIEFQKRTGCSCAFYRFFRTIRQKMWECGHSNSAEPLEDEFQRASISPDSQDRSEISPGFNLASLLQMPEEEEEEEEKVDAAESDSEATDESTLRHLAEMARSDYLDQKMQALCALAELTQSPSVDFAAMERTQVPTLLFECLSSPHAEVQRLAAAVLAHVSEHLPASHRSLGKHLDDFSTIFERCPCRETVRRACRALCSVVENSMRKREGRARERASREGRERSLSGGSDTSDDCAESACQVLRCLEIKQRCGQGGDPRLESMLARTLRSAGPAR